MPHAKGRIRYYHFGEGSYQETEVAIQGLIRELNPGASVRVEIALKGAQRAGDDVKFDGKRGFITVDRPRMYSVVANESVVSGGLTIRAEAAGLAAYAFTFISCVVS